MKLGEMRPIGPRELAEHGIHYLAGSAALSVRERTPGNIILLAMRGTSTEFRIDTTTARPDHAVFAFVEAEALWSRNQDEPWLQIESGLVIAAPGMVRTVRCQGSWRAAIAFVPREAMAMFVPALPADAQIFPDRRLLDRAMQNFIQGLLSADERATAIERYAVEQLIVEMSGAILLDRAGATLGHGSPRAVLRDKAMAVIAQQCGDPSLTPNQVAREVQSSLRQLQLVFAEAENSVADEIRRQRARLARTLLVDSRYDVLSVEQIAKRAGFRSPMSLRRAIAEAYNTTPRALRSQRRT
ncbi:helix-turn-helix domain-containing protein [Microbacterium sp. W4I20]|uniref:helix-turn-helix domain-containing protein n=1 Tax=Microbacterium sp. W4I20 TaxID=3042262 RepID=UPI002787F6B6|nr:helix-turn-helix domain-containing protein [Microbacterium sp. W4I20]MDQ0729148.1 AraC-like DNA-binding protein [Microbacterium sp. W4I20]